MNDTARTDTPLRILVTGATGYIGGRLTPRLVAAGHRVRALARNPDKISDVPWAADVEVVRGDLADPESLEAACRDVDVVYYLVHSMAGGGAFVDAENAAAPRTSPPSPAGRGWAASSTWADCTRTRTGCRCTCAPAARSVRY